MKAYIGSVQSNSKDTISILTFEFLIEFWMRGDGGRGLLNAYISHGTGPFFLNDGVDTETTERKKTPQV